MKRRMSVSGDGRPVPFPDLFDSYKNENGYAIEVEMKRPSFSREAYDVYYQYQTVVFGEKSVTEHAYREFLVSTPLMELPLMFVRFILLTRHPSV